MQHPKKTHTSAHTPRSHRYRLEQKQFTSCLESSLRFEYAHHQTQFNYSPSRKLVANFGTRKSVDLFTSPSVLISRTRLEKDVRPGQHSFQPRLIFQSRPIPQTRRNLSNPPNLSNPAAIFQTLSNPAQSFKPRSIFQTPLKTVIPSGADRLLLPPSLLRRRRSAQSRNLSSIPREATRVSPSLPPLAPSPSEFPPASVAIGLQILDPSACSTCAPPNSPANKSCP